MLVFLALLLSSPVYGQVINVLTNPLQVGTGMVFNLSTIPNKSSDVIQMYSVEYNTRTSSANVRDVCSDWPIIDCIWQAGENLFPYVGKYFVVYRANNVIIAKSGLLQVQPLQFLGVPKTVPIGSGFTFNVSAMPSQSDTLHIWYNGYSTASINVGHCKYCTYACGDWPLEHCSWFGEALFPHTGVHTLQYRSTANRLWAQINITVTGMSFVDTPASVGVGGYLKFNLSEIPNAGDKIVSWHNGTIVSTITVKYAKYDPECCPSWPLDACSWGGESVFPYAGSYQLQYRAQNGQIWAKTAIEVVDNVFFTDFPKSVGVGGYIRFNISRMPRSDDKFVLWHNGSEIASILVGYSRYDPASCKKWPTDLCSWGGESIFPYAGQYEMRYRANNGQIYSKSALEVIDDVFFLGLPKTVSVGSYIKFNVSSIPNGGDHIVSWHNGTVVAEITVNTPYESNSCAGWPKDLCSWGGKSVFPYAGNFEWQYRAKNGRTWRKAPIQVVQ